MTPFWDDRVAGWVAGRIWGDGRAFGECRAMGVEHAGDLVAGLVFHDWNPDAGTVEISAAATDRRWPTRGVINAALTYAFGACGCQMVVARQSIDNAPARRLWLAIGATEIVLPRLYGRDADGTLIMLTDDQWQRSKFNKEARNGKILGSEAA